MFRVLNSAASRCYIEGARTVTLKRYGEDMGIQIEVPRDMIGAFCRIHKIRSLSFFGSVLRDDFRPDSDVDILVEFEAGVEPGLRELVTIENELSQIFGRKADMVERRSVESSDNYIRRRHVLQSVEAVYVA